MKNLFKKTAPAAVAAMLLGLTMGGQTQAAVVLNPLSLPSGTSLAAGGLAATWYKIDNDARFSQAQYDDPLDNPDVGSVTIGATTWGTGIWDISDLTAIAGNPRPAYVTGSATSVGAVNFANNIYNNTVKGGSTYGTWEADYVRPLAPTVGASNGCDPELIVTPACANEVNYAAMFTGYLHVVTGGVYDFGVFADDIYGFSLTGLEGVYSRTKSAVAGNPGRTFETLNTGGFTLSEGYYGINLNYANRLEAGVINLVWKESGKEWETIGTSTLYNEVPEPATLALTFLGLMGVWGSRKRIARPKKAAAV